MAQKSKYDKIKIFTLGNSDVGKTAFITKFTEDYFSNTQFKTIGIENITNNITLPNGKTYSVNFWDTAGQERYKSISLNSIKKADGIILMYDITHEESFNAIPKWMEDIKENKGLDFPIILLGNKFIYQRKEKFQKQKEWN